MIVGLCFDFMQNLLLPQIPVQETFYFRQLWAYVFCVYNTRTGVSQLYLYSEGKAGKGANEVCSMIYDYISNNIKPENVKELHLFSDGDGSCGQNKNHGMLRMCCALKQKFPVVRSHFPVRGHSFLPCDRVFGQIKQKLSHTDRFYCPRDYIKIMSSICNVEIYFIKEDSNVFLNFDKWWPEYYMKSTTALETAHLSASRRTKLQPTKFMEYHYENDGIIRLFKNIGCHEMKNFRLKKNAIRTQIPFPTELAYSGPKAINEKKRTDVMKLKKYVPITKLCCKKFWKELESYPTTNKDDNDS